MAHRRWFLMRQRAEAVPGRRAYATTVWVVRVLHKFFTKTSVLDSTDYWRSMMSTQTATEKTRKSAALVCGAGAGTLLVVVGLAKSFTRGRFDLRHDTLSLLGTGDLWWIQVLNFVLSGVLYVVGAVGM